MKSTLKLFAPFYLLAILGCVQSFDDQTIAIIDRQKISASTFHKKLPATRFYSFDDSTRILKLEDFLKEFLIKRDIERMNIQNEPEIKKEMDVWSKRTIVGMLFNKMVLDKIFPEDRLMSIYDQFIHERNVSVVVIPYTNNEKDQIPSRVEAQIIANRVYEMSQSTDFGLLQKEFSKSPSRTTKGREQSYWAQLFRGIKVVDRKIWDYNIGDVCEPIDDGQAFRIIKINGERKNERVPPFKQHKETLIGQVMELWKKPLFEAFSSYTKDLLDISDFYLDLEKVRAFSDQLNRSMNGKDIITGLESMKHREPIGRYSGITIDRQWLLKSLKEEKNMLAENLADRSQSVAFITGLVSTKLNYKTAIEMGYDKSPIYKKKLREEFAVRTRNFYEQNIYFEKNHIIDDDLYDYYTNNKKDFTTPANVLAYLIWFKDNEDANNYYEKIISKQVSYDKLYKQIESNKNMKNGTKKDFIRLGSKTDPFAGLFTLRNNEISIPFKRGNKYFIAKVIEKIPPQERSFQEVKSSVKFKLERESKEKEEKKARKRLFNKYGVRINEDLVFGDAPY